MTDTLSYMDTSAVGLMVYDSASASTPDMSRSLLADTEAGNEEQGQTECMAAGDLIAGDEMEPGAALAVDFATRAPTANLAPAAVQEESAAVADGPIEKAVDMFDDLVTPETKAAMEAAGHGDALVCVELPTYRIGIDVPTFPCQLVPATLDDIEAISDLELRAEALLMNRHLAKEGPRADSLYLSVKDAFIKGAFAYADWERRNDPPPPEPVKLKRRRYPKRPRHIMPSLFDTFPPDQVG